MLSRKNALKSVLNQYGKVPKVNYEVGDLESIKAYHDYRVEKGLDSFVLDDITWNDLSMNDLFKRINLGLSTSGEQYLYHQLRNPAVTEDSFVERKRLIETFEDNEAFRKSVQKILYRLGKNKKAKLSEVFKPGKQNGFRLFAYILMASGFLISAISMLFTWDYLLVLVFFVIVNSLIREMTKKKIYQDLETVNYAVSTVLAAKKIIKIKNNPLKELATEFENHLDQLNVILRTGNVSVTSGSEVGDVFSTWLLLDLITYELLKNVIGKNYKSVFKIHEAVGKIEASLSIASYRTSVHKYSVPDLQFTNDSSPYLIGKELVHPLVKDCVPNDLTMVKSHLISGSNASGKSTFIKTLALNAIMAQSICTVLADQYKASVFKIYSSMALSDDILSGESYYISEIKSLKRIVDASKLPEPILCLIDEVLRGTNTVERIAASSEILKYLSEQKALSLVATHDMELCHLLKNTYEMIHFQESFEDNQMVFDYTLKAGEAKSRNAIKLLSVLGFNDEIVRAAEERANEYEAFSTK